MDDYRNVFLYWVGKEYKLIKLLRNLIYLHSTNGKGYKVHLITNMNINEYIEELPDYFSSLIPAHQADYIRVQVLCERGGIWLDSDTLVLDSLDSLFDLVETTSGFFIRENNTILWNGIFGTKKQTPLMIEWKNQMMDMLRRNAHRLQWSAIGCQMLQSMYDTNPGLYENYTLFNGLDNMYPVNWDRCVTEFITKPHDNCRNLIRDYQPLVVLVNSVYKAVESKPLNELFEGNMPLNYFINKSFMNMNHLINYDFIEIGTSNFDTLIQGANNTHVGISVDAVKYYIDQLPDKLNCKKIHAGISNIDSSLDVYYIPEEIIIANRLPDWFKGCNCINNYHPLHIKHKVTNLCTKETVKVITPYRLFYENKVRQVSYLKIDTEGHDCIILKSLHSYLQYLPKQFYPNKILFESNEHTVPAHVDEIIILYSQIGYILHKRGYDTELRLGS